MITVTSPTGVRVQYNDACHVETYVNYASLYTEKGGRWIATAPTTWLIEAQRPCRVTNAGVGTDEAEEIVMERLDKFSVTTLRKLKARLQDFDARTGEWK